MCRSIFKWLLSKGIMGAALILNLISAIILGIAMFILNWYYKNH